MSSKGNFHFIQHIQNGANGSVSLYQDFPSKKYYAIKEIPLTCRYEKEIADQLSKIQFKNVVQIYGTFQWDQYLNIIMEYCNGSNLHDQIHNPKQKVDFDIFTVIKILLEVARGIQELKSQKIIHRDIKPLNIVCVQPTTGARIYKICDIGASKTADLATSTFIGTPYYMAPELMTKAAEQQDYKVDVWSLGIVAYEIIQGKFFYNDKTEFYLTRTNLTYEKLALLKTQWMEDDVKNLIRGMLKINPQERPPIEAVIEKLDQILIKHTPKQKTIKILSGQIQQSVLKEQTQPIQQPVNNIPTQKNADKSLIQSNDSQKSNELRQETSKIEEKLNQQINSNEDQLLKTLTNINFNQFKIDYLEQKEKQLQNSLANKSLLLKELESSHQEKKQQHDDLKGEIKLKNEEIKISEDKNQILQDEIKKTQTDYQGKVKCFEILGQLTENLTKEKLEKAGQIDNLNMQIKQSEQDIENQKRCLEEQDKQMKSLQENIGKISQMIEGLQTEISKKQEIIHNLQNEEGTTQKALQDKINNLKQLSDDESTIRKGILDFSGSIMVKATEVLQLKKEEMGRQVQMEQEFLNKFSEQIVQAANDNSFKKIEYPNFDLAFETLTRNIHDVVNGQHTYQQKFAAAISSLADFFNGISGQKEINERINQAELSDMFTNNEQQELEHEISHPIIPQGQKEVKKDFEILEKDQIVIEDKQTNNLFINQFKDLNIEKSLSLSQEINHHQQYEQSLQEHLIQDNQNNNSEIIQLNKVDNVYNLFTTQKELSSCEVADGDVPQTNVQDLEVSQIQQFSQPTRLEEIQENKVDYFLTTVILKERREVSEADMGVHKNDIEETEENQQQGQQFGQQDQNSTGNSETQKTFVNDIYEQDKQLYHELNQDPGNQQ